MGHGELLLVVEDNPHISMLAQEMLIELGYRTILADTAEAALQRLREEPGVAALFTDVVLPGGRSGIELVSAAIALRPELKVLYTTGYTERDLMSRSLLQHGALLLEKPYRRQELAEKLYRTIHNGSAAPSGGS